MYIHTGHTSTYSSLPGTYSSIQDIYISFVTAVYNQYERRRASDGERAMFVHRSTAYVAGAALLLLALYVDFLSLPISVGIAGAPS